ncbi:MAG: murein biosynthesis integral membrane protein MurJ [Bdellovibrionota bacterium]
MSSSDRSSRGAASLVAFGILLSRVAGLVRERAIAHFLGNDVAAGAFRAAYRIPNFLQNLFGEGVLSASFIPIYSRLRAQGDHETAEKLASVIGTVLALFVSVVSLVGILVAPIVVALIAPGFDGEVKQLTVTIVRILFPGIGLLVMSAWCLGILNSHRKFFLSYAAPVVWNFAMIAALVIYGGSSSQNDLAIALAWGAVVGSVLQLAVQLPVVLKVAGSIRPAVSFKMQSVRDVFTNMGPVFMGRGVAQISAYIDSMVSSFLGPAAVASISYAQTLYLLPVSLFGMSIAAAELPEMSIVGGADDVAKEKLRTRIRSGRRRIAFFVIPSIAAFLILGRAVVAALYQTGRFGHDDTYYVWYILMGSCIGLLPATWGRLYSSAFYALGDTKTPFRIALVRVTTSIVLGLAFAFPLRPLFVQFFSSIPFFGLPKIDGIEVGLGAVGLTFGSALAGWGEFALLRRALTPRIGAADVATKTLVKIWSAALGAAALAVAVDTIVFDSGETAIRILHYNWQPLLILATFGVSYLLFALALKVEETSAITARLFKRK